jgi:hypothetical protein
MNARHALAVRILDERGATRQWPPYGLVQKQPVVLDRRSRRTVSGCRP